jgi:hypothetical protein
MTGFGFVISKTEMSMAALPWCGSGSIFFEDIEKLHESGKISVFTNETP